MNHYWPHLKLIWTETKIRTKAKIFDKIKRTPTTTKSSAIASKTITMNMSARTITIYVQVLR